MSLVKTFRSKGKLLITGEYAVLDGALALAIPTQKGQQLDVYLPSIENNKIGWKAYKQDGSLWNCCTLDIEEERIIETTDVPFAETLLQIFLEVKNNNPSLVKNGYECETQIEFPENWGFGSSSTLINNIAKWADIDPYRLLKKTFGGSGYDIACANAETPITYQVKEDTCIVKEVYLKTEITELVYFVYLNKKQNSREGIKQYRQKEKSKKLINSITEITQEIISPKISFQTFSTLMIEHENLISNFLEMKTVKENLFPDYTGFIKSLGAWGGDFVMVEKLEGSKDYFENKGYRVIKEYDEILL